MNITQNYKYIKLKNKDDYQKVEELLKQNNIEVESQFNNCDSQYFYEYASDVLNGKYDSKPEELNNVSEFGINTIAELASNYFVNTSNTMEVVDEAFYQLVTTIIVDIYNNKKE